MQKNPNTTETYLKDQIERIKRFMTPKGSNAIMDWIEDFNKEFKKDH